MSEQNQSPEEEGSKKVVEPPPSDEDKSAEVPDKKRDGAGDVLNPEPSPPRVSQ